MNKLFIVGIAMLLLAGCTTQSNEKNQVSKESNLAKVTSCTNLTETGSKRVLIQTDGTNVTSMTIINEVTLKDAGMTKEEAENQHKTDAAKLAKGVSSSLSFQDDVALFETKVSVVDSEKATLESYGFKMDSKGKINLNDTIKGLGCQHISNE